MNLDLSILYFFNRTLSADWLDPIMILLTNVKAWMPVYIIGAILAIYYKRWSGLRMVLSTIILIGLLDLSTNLLLKPLVARERPCAEVSPGHHIVDWIRLPDGERFGYSFPSSHALNNFGGVIFFIAVFPRRKWLYWLLVPAAIVAITRLYLGLHYPSDTLGGALIGAVCGLVWARMHHWFEQRFAPNRMGTQ
ncbi:MAG TPA: phosphatase PAP2 family protein [Candidatus Kapabacteria bacterium]|nr:phosphatase PAP2 family protein [Candidatus Kapabacteria bacterium]